MTTQFVGIQTATATVATNTVQVAAPAGVQEGDILVFMIIADASTTVSALPSVDWKPRFNQFLFTGSGASYCSAVKWVKADDPTTYSFTLSGSVTWIAMIAAYRGTVRDFYDTTNYPYGIFNTSGGSEGWQKTASSNTLDITDGAHPTLPNTAVPYARVLYMFAQEATSPVFDDPSPLITIRAALHNTQFAVMFADMEYAATSAPPPDVTVKSSQGAAWVTVTDILEPLAGVDPTDNYKSKLLRKTLPPPYDTRLSSNLGKLLTVIGSSDNDIGGLFGEDDFLPNEVP